MRSVKHSSVQKKRTLMIQSFAFIAMMIVPVFLFFAAEAESMGWILILLICEAFVMAVSMIVS